MQTGSGVFFSLCKGNPQNVSSPECVKHNYGKALQGIQKNITNNPLENNENDKYKYIPFLKYIMTFIGLYFSQDANDDIPYNIPFRKDIFSFFNYIVKTQILDSKTLVFPQLFWKRMLTESCSIQIKKNSLLFIERKKKIEGEIEEDNIYLCTDKGEIHVFRIGPETNIPVNFQQVSQSKPQKPQQQIQPQKPPQKQLQIQQMQQQLQKTQVQIKEQKQPENARVEKLSSIFLEFYNNKQSFLKSMFNDNILKKYTSASSLNNIATITAFITNTKLDPKFSKFNYEFLELFQVWWMHPKSIISQIKPQATPLTLYSGGRFPLHDRHGNSILSKDIESNIYLMTFLSTSTDEHTALSFKGECLYKIEVPANLIKYLMPVKLCSVYEHENEIILPIGTILKFKGYTKIPVTTKPVNLNEYYIINLTLQEYKKDVITAFKNIFTDKNPQSLAPPTLLSSQHSQSSLPNSSQHSQSSLPNSSQPSQSSSQSSLASQSFSSQPSQSSQSSLASQSFSSQSSQNSCYSDIPEKIINNIKKEINSNFQSEIQPKVGGKPQIQSRSSIKSLIFDNQIGLFLTDADFNKDKTKILNVIESPIIEPVVDLYDLLNKRLLSQKASLKLPPIRNSNKPNFITKEMALKQPLPYVRYNINPTDKDIGYINISELPVSLDKITYTTTFNERKKKLNNTNILKNKNSNDIDNIMANFFIKDKSETFKKIKYQHWILYKLYKDLEIKLKTLKLQTEQNINIAKLNEMKNSLDYKIILK